MKEYEKLDFYNDTLKKIFIYYENTENMDRDVGSDVYNKFCLQCNTDKIKKCLNMSTDELCGFCEKFKGFYEINKPK